MGADDEHRCCCLESYAALDADDGVAHMAVAADSILCSDFLNGLNGLHMVCVFSAIHRAEFAFLESQSQDFGAFLCWVFQVGRLGQTLC